MYITNLEYLNTVQIIGNRLEFALMIDALPKIDGYNAHVRIMTSEMTTLNSICVMNAIKDDTSYDLKCSLYDMESSLYIWKRYNKYIEVRPKTLSDRMSVWRYIDSNLIKMKKEEITNA